MPNLVDLNLADCNLNNSAIARLSKINFPFLQRLNLGIFIFIH